MDGDKDGVVTFGLLQVGGHLGHFGALRGIWGHFGAFGGTLGSFCRHLGPFGDYLGIIWGSSGVTLGSVYILGAVTGSFQAI